jgi:hypothetical protein
MMRATIHPDPRCAMVQKTTTNVNGAVDALIQDCAATLRNLAAYQLPAALNGRLLWLSENKEKLTESERGELNALIDFSEDRTVEKLQAKVMLRRLADAWPHLLGSPP